MIADLSQSACMHITFVCAYVYAFEFLAQLHSLLLHPSSSAILLTFAPHLAMKILLAIFTFTLISSTLGFVLPLNVSSPVLLLNISSLPEHSSNDTTTPNLLGWPEAGVNLHIRDNFYLHILELFREANITLEAEILESLEMMDVEIESEGAPSGSIEEMAYQYGWVGLVIGVPTHPELFAPISRSLASDIIGFISGLIYLYGPREFEAWILDGQRPITQISFIFRGNGEPITAGSGTG